MSTDLVIAIMNNAHEAGHHIVSDAVHGADQGATKAVANITQKAIEYGFRKVESVFKKKIEEGNIQPSETPNIDVLRDVVSASQNTFDDIKIDLLAMLTVKAAQNHSEFYTKKYVDKIEQMSPNAAKCMRMFVNYPNLSVLSDYRDMMGAVSLKMETAKNVVWLNNSSVRQRFSLHADKENITPEIAYIAFSELHDLGIISGDHHQIYRLSPLGIGMIRALQIHKPA